MTRKRQPGASIDLRRPRGESGGFGRLGRRVFLVALVGMTIVAGAAVMLEVLATVRPSVFPIKDMRHMQFVLENCEGAEAPADCRPEVEWQVEVMEVRQPSQGVRVGDRVLSIDGKPVGSLPESEEERRLFLASLEGARSLPIVLARDRRVRQVSEFGFAGVTRWQSPEFNSTSDRDTVQERETLPEVLARLAPGGHGLSPAQVTEITDAVLAHTDLTDLGPGVVITVERTHEVDERPRPDHPITEVTLRYSGNEEVRLQRGEDGWGPPVMEVPLEITLMRPPWREALVAIAYRAAILFVLLGGILALRAKSRAVALPRFLLLCLLFSLPAVPSLAASWARWADPALAFGREIAMVVIAFALPAMLVGAILVLVFLGAFLRLLHVFPSRDPELARRFRVPRVLPAIAVGSIVLFAVIWSMALRGVSRSSALILAGAIPVLLLTYLVVILVLIVRILRLAKAQAAIERDAEGSEKRRMALFGVKYGFLILTLAIVLSIMPRGYTTAMPWTVTLDNSLTFIRDLLIPIGLIAPFIGFFLAILGRGLWDVDLIVKRTTVYSVLTGLFVVLLLALEVTAENVLPGRLFGVAWIDDLTVAALATGLVAVSHRWIKTGLTRRFFSESVNFDRAIEEVSEDMATPDSESSPAKYLGQRLTAVLSANPCAVLVRLGENLFRKVWSTNETVPVSLVAGAASTALETNPSAIVMTDEGPILAARIGKGEQYPGLLLLGPRRGGRFYTSEERRLLTPLLNQAALLLKSSG